MKRKIVFPVTFLILALTLMLSCDDDDDTVNVDSVPEFTSLKTSVSSLPGQVFVFEGVVTDPAGIKSINIKYEPWFLDKTIQRDSVTESYDLAYKFQVPEEETENSVHTIPITITNIGDKSFTGEVTVTLDQDIANPVIRIDQPIDQATIPINDGNEIDFDITVTDAELAEFIIESDLIQETISISGTSFTYSNSLNVTDPNNYSFTVTTTDLSGNSSSQIFSVNVVDELQFLNMYLIDSNDASIFDAALGGYPYLGTNSTVEGEEGFVFNFRYYAEQDDTEVFFIAQQASFAPFAFGRAENEGSLVIGSDETVSPVVLPTSGYYEIGMDLRDLSYTVSELVPPPPPVIDANFTGVYVTGTGLIVGGMEINAYNPPLSAPMEVDPNNPFRYSETVQFNADNGSFIFIGNQSSYSVFWRVNSSPITTTNAIVPQGGTECFFETLYSGSYKLTVDIFLNTFTIIKI